MSESNFIPASESDPARVQAGAEFGRKHSLAALTPPKRANMSPVVAQGDGRLSPNLAAGLESPLSANQGHSGSGSIRRQVSELDAAVRELALEAPHSFAADVENLKEAMRRFHARQDAIEARLARLEVQIG